MARNPKDSPSRQLIHDLTRDLEQVRIHNHELKRVKAYERKSFYERLDRLDREREHAHEIALSAAASKRDLRRRQAEETLRVHLQAVEEKRVREQAEREHIEREKEKERLRLREKEEREKVERARLAQKEKEEEAERERVRIKEKAEADEKERIIQEQKQKEQQEEAVKQERLKQEKDNAQAKQKNTSSTTASGLAHRTPEEIAEQNRHVELHKHLKSFRKYMVEQTKSDANLKKHMGDMRRTIRKCVGQLLAEDKVANRKPTKEILTTLKNATTVSQLNVDVRQFIAFPSPALANAPSPQVPALLVYLLNILSKSLIAQLIAEAGVSLKYAEPIGVLAAQIFSMEAFAFQGHSLFDLLLCKYRVLCPVLWGVYGSESTVAGKIAIGWRKEEPDDFPDTKTTASSATPPSFISRQAHEQRMSGLGAGFAALALRNFSKTPRQNPFPNTNFWHALACILNVPPAEIQPTHLLVLAAMLRFSATRVVGFWGDMGLLVLKQAILVYPDKLQVKSEAQSAVQVLRSIYADEYRIFL